MFHLEQKRTDLPHGSLAACLGHWPSLMFRCQEGAGSDIGSRSQPFSRHWSTGYFFFSMLHAWKAAVGLMAELPTSTC